MCFPFASTPFGIVPADLQSAGIEYQNRRSAQLIMKRSSALADYKSVCKKNDEEPLDIKQKYRPDSYNDLALM